MNNNKIYQLLMSLTGEELFKTKKKLVVEDNIDLIDIIFNKLNEEKRDKLLDHFKNSIMNKKLHLLFIGVSILNALKSWKFGVRICFFFANNVFLSIFFRYALGFFTAFPSFAVEGGTLRWITLQIARLRECQS